MMQLHPENTAISHKKPSRPAAHILGTLQFHSILDYMCGHSSDADFFQNFGKKVSSYDPHPAYNRNILPVGKYDLVTITYVLNVIPDREERVQILKEAATYMKDNGRMVVTVRPCSEILREAKKKDWGQFGDGYISSLYKGTVQVGLSRESLILHGKDAGLVPAPEQLSIPGATCIVFMKASTLNNAIT